MPLNMWPSGQSIWHVVRTRWRVLSHAWVDLAAWQFGISGCTFRAESNPSPWLKSHLKCSSPLYILAWMFIQAEQGNFKKGFFQSMHFLHFCSVTCMSKFDCEALMWCRKHFSLFQHESVNFSCFFGHLLGDLMAKHKHIFHSVTGICIQYSALQMTKIKPRSLAFNHLFPLILTGNMMLGKAVDLLIGLSVKILYNSICSFTLLDCHY